LEKLEQQNKRQRLGLLVLAVALCGVVTMGATDSKYATFDTVVARHIFTTNDAVV
jgi:hypothetical protein